MYYAKLIFKAIDALVALITPLMAYLAGKFGERNKIIKKTAEIEREQLKIAANAPKTKEGILHRLWGRGL